MHFHEVSIGSYSNRGHIYETDQLFSQAAVASMTDAQAQHSYFSFGEDGVRYIEENGAMNGRFTGIMYMPHLILDFDGKEETLVDTTKEMRQFVRYLLKHQNVPEEALSVWFSGKKGYHIYLDGRLFGVEPSASLPAAIKQTVKEHYGHPMVDTIPINKAGMIRMPYSLHPDTKLRKIPVPMHILFKQTPELVSEIVSTRETNLAFKVDMSQMEQMEECTAILKGVLESAPSYAEQGDMGRAKHNPERMVTCMQHLMARGPGRGRRHQDTLRLASWLWRSGIPEDAAVRSLEGWLDHRDLDRIVGDTYKNGYSYGCRDSVMAEFCDPSCVFAKKRDYTMNATTGTKLIESLQRHTDLVRKGKGFNLSKMYRGIGRYSVVPGEMVVIAADTGIGKSLFAQDLIRRAGGKAIYLNTECAEHLLTRRFIQNRTGYTKDEVYRALNDINQAAGFAELLNDLIMVSNSPSNELVERMAEDFKPDILVVDTTDGVAVPEAGNSDMWQMKAVIETLRKIAQQQQVIVIAIHHLNKQGARAIKGENMDAKKRRLSLEDLSGRRDIVTKFDHVWGIEGDRNSFMRTLRTLKQRDEPELVIDMVFDFDRMAIKRADEAPTDTAEDEW